MPNAEAISAEEAHALAGMHQHRRLAVPSDAFQHEGRRALVRHWEQSGRIGIMVTDLEAAAAAANLILEPLYEAAQDVEQMCLLMDTLPVWEEYCEAVNRRYRVAKAQEDAARAMAEYNRTGTAAHASAASAAFQRLVEAEAPQIHAQTGTELFDRLMAEASANHGREFLGISFGYLLSRLNARMDGLRGLTFMAGAPGTGKTTLALQMAFDAACFNHDTVVVFLTCEMSALEVEAMLVTHFTEIPFNVLMKGRRATTTKRYGNSTIVTPIPLSASDMEPTSIELAPRGLDLPSSDIIRLKEVREQIAYLGHRWHVVHPSDVGGVFMGTKNGGASVFAPITALANRAKQASGATRVLVVVDSLQKVPVSEPESGSVTGWRGEAIERDRYVIAALNDLGSTPGDAVLCISEQQKTAQGRAEITAMAGTVASGYACDSCLMLTDPPEYKPDPTTGRSEKKDKDQQEGIRTVEVHLVKGRAGCVRGHEDMVFSYHTHTFYEVTGLGQ